MAADEGTPVFGTTFFHKDVPVEGGDDIWYEDRLELSDRYLALLGHMQLLSHRHCKRTGKRISTMVAVFDGRKGWYWFPAVSTTCDTRYFDPLRAPVLIVDQFKYNLECLALGVILREDAKGRKEAGRLDKGGFLRDWTKDIDRVVSEALDRAGAAEADEADIAEVNEAAEADIAEVLEAEEATAEYEDFEHALVLQVEDLKTQVRRLEKRQEDDQQRLEDAQRRFDALSDRMMQAHTEAERRFDALSDRMMQAQEEALNRLAEAERRFDALSAMTKKALEDVQKATMSSTPPARYTGFEATPSPATSPETTTDKPSGTAGNIKKATSPETTTDKPSNPPSISKWDAAVGAARRMARFTGRPR